MADADEDDYEYEEEDAAEVPPSDGLLRNTPLKKSGGTAAEGRLKRVPSWLYDKKEDVFGLTKASFIWWLNVVCTVFHLFFAITTVIVATRDGKGMDTPRLTVYLTNLTWQANSTDALIPVNVPQDGLYLAHMTLWFFLLSALAHGYIVLGNYTQAFALNNKANRKFTTSGGWYYRWIQECRQPLRWIECKPRRRRSLVDSPTPIPIACRHRMQTRQWHNATGTWRA